MSLQEKQQFLSQEIIEQGYNAEEFSAFISNVRGEEEVNLEAWSLEDLKTVCDQFKAQYGQNQANPENQEVPEQNEIEGQYNASQEQPPNPQEQNQENNEEQKSEEQQEAEQKPATQNEFPNNLLDPLTLTFTTEKLEPNEITDKNDLSITITNPQKIRTGLLSKPYFQYDMETIPMGYKVVRKVNDFTFLYEKLPLFNNHVFNPILPHFEFGLKDDSAKKMLYIQNYMNSLVENKFFRTLPIVFEFLTLPQEKWNNKRNEYMKMKPLPLSKMKSLEGELVININKEEDTKALKIKEIISKKTEALDLFNTTIDEIIAIFDKLGVLYKTLARSLLDLEKVHQSDEVMKGFYNRLKTLCILWSEDYVKEKELYKEEFKYYFKFINKESVSYLKKFDEFKAVREEYKSKFEKVKKMQIKPAKDLELVKKLRVDYGIQLAAINEEYKKLIQRQAQRCMIQFMKYNEKQDIILQDYEYIKKLFNVNIPLDDPHEVQENPHENQET